jgi:hypothetical protein
MRKPQLPVWSFFLVGLAAILALQAQFFLLWHPFYSRFPWRGYENATAEGNIPPSISGSRMTLYVAMIALLLLPLIVLWFTNARRQAAAILIWAGVMVGVVLVWIATPRLRQDSNMWPIDLVILAIETGIPLAIGASIQGLVSSRRRAA